MTSAESTPAEPVLYTVSGAVATITFNRPDAMNALDVATKEALLAALRRAAADESVRAVVLTGTGRAFCVGQDLREHVQKLMSGEPPLTTVRDHYNPITLAIVEMPKPIIAALNGAAAGGGMIPALCADIRLAADTMFFTTSFAQRGLIAEHGISWLLPRLVGPSRALEMLMTARRISAPEAEATGLVNKVFPSATFRDDAQAYAAAIAKTVSPRSLAVMKAQVWKAMAQSFRDALATADVQLELSVKTSDYIEGVSHFLEKRAANFPDLDPERG